jgi:hypothetical protein
MVSPVLTAKRFNLHADASLDAQANKLVTPDWTPILKSFQQRGLCELSRGLGADALGDV